MLIAVCGLPELPEHLTRASEVLSLTDPGYDESPHFLGYAGEVRRFKFDDVWPDGRGGIAPTEADVAAILEAIDRAVERSGSLLVHCHAGQSRSTAVALLALAIAHPDWTAEDCVRELYAIRPQASPNPGILERAGRLRPRLAGLRAAIRELRGW